MRIKFVRFAEISSTCANSQRILKIAAELEFSGSIRVARVYFEK